MWGKGGWGVPSTLPRPPKGGKGKRMEDPRPHPKGEEKRRTGGDNVLDISIQFPLFDQMNRFRKRGAEKTEFLFCFFDLCVQRGFLRGCYLHIWFFSLVFVVRFFSLSIIFFTMLCLIYGGGRGFSKMTKIEKIQGGEGNNENSSRYKIKKSKVGKQTHLFRLLKLLLRSPDPMLQRLDLTPLIINRLLDRIQ